MKSQFTNELRYSLWWGLGFCLAMTVLGTSLWLLNSMFPSFGIELFGAILPYTFFILLPGIILAVEVLSMTTGLPYNIVVLSFSLFFYFLVGMGIGWFICWCRQQIYGPGKSASSQFVSLDLSSKTQKEE